MWTLWGPYFQELALGAVLAQSPLRARSVETSLEPQKVIHDLQAKPVLSNNWKSKRTTTVTHLVLLVELYIAYWHTQEEYIYICICICKGGLEYP